ncbi:MAG: hypothetical protein WC710_14525 [Gallionella sp.]
MSSVTIVLTDNEDGLVTQTVSYTSDKGGFDVNSQAHQYSAGMLRMAREIIPTQRDGAKAAGVILLD